MKNKKEQLDEYKTFKTFDGIDLSMVPGSVTEILTTNFERFNTCKTYEDVVALCHELLDNASLDTNWTRKFFYQLEQIKTKYPNPRAAFERAMIYVNNARMKGMGLGMSKRRFYEGEELNESMTNDQVKEFKDKLKAGEVKFEYAKKDGSTKQATGTLKPDLLPVKTTDAKVDAAIDKQKTKRNLSTDSVFYYDLDDKGFRSFKMSNFVKYL